MELKVWVEGVQRVVCGVTEASTCQDVVYALAHATGRTGRFTLVERWRNNERLLAPQEHPAKVLMKWGEYAADVQLILLRSPLERSPPRARRAGRAPARSGAASAGGPAGPASDASATTILSPQLERRRSDLRLLEHVKRGTVGVVRPQPPVALDDSMCSSEASLEKPARSVLSPPPYREPPAAVQRVSAPGSAPAPRQPPPYRPPPPPGQHPGSPSSASQSSHTVSGGSASAGSPSPSPPAPAPPRPPDTSGTAYDAHYRHLLTVVNKQRHQLNSLQADVTQCDAEIGQLEASLRQQEHQLTALRGQSSQLQQLLEQHDREISQLEPGDQLRREAEAGQRLQDHGKQLKAKLTACETELSTCSEKITELSEQLHAERLRLQQSEAADDAELQQLSEQLRQLQLSAADSEQRRLALQTELSALGGQLEERQTRVQQLMEQLRAENLRSLQLSPAEEAARGGDAGGAGRPPPRQLVGSPRQLENAVPTSRNPHGVWV